MSQTKESVPKSRRRPAHETKRAKQNRKFEEVGIQLKEPPPSQVVLQIVHNGCLGMGKCVYLSTSNTSYLFNCPEGVQRLIGEHRLKVSRLDHVFFTQGTWLNTGGLPGMSLAMESSGVEKITIHGPPNLRKIFEAVRMFGANICSVVVEEKPYTDLEFEDHVMKVQYVPFFKKHTGKVNVEKCKALGVPLGPCLKTLKEGDSVTLPNGNTIHPCDVLDPPEKTAKFLVIDCPSTEFLDSLVNQQKIHECRHQLDMILHFSKASVVNTLVYQGWMKSVGVDTKHVILNHEAPILPHSNAVAEFQIQLNSISEKFFPLLYCQEEENLTNQREEKENVIYSEPFMKFNLRPLTLNSLNHSESASSLQTCSKKTKLEDNFEEEEADNPIDTAPQVQRFPSLDRCMSVDKFPEIFFLGTSAAFPGKYRNMSGIGLNLDSETTAILDCGEGSYQQLFHLFGPETCDQFLMKLRFIFISHLHMDHHFGLYTMIKRRQEAFQRHCKEDNPGPPVCYLMAPKQLFKVHRMYEELIEDFGGHFYMEQIAIDDGEETKRSLKRVGVEVGVRRVEVVEVDHRLCPYGILLTTHNGYNLVYSGDTRPCPNLIHKGKGADLLIHEATFENDLQQDAINKKHSTIAEAVHCGTEMQAKLTVLTHFSGRYPKVPPVSPEMLSGKVAIAFDNMRFSLDEGKELAGLIPQLELAFPTLEKTTDKTDIVKG